MVCIYCRREIREGERRYYSHQAGMKGIYHWECFVAACRKANRSGAQEIESNTVIDGIFENLRSYSFIGDR